jgi:pimeloyl-ACP methyl ester carboxylesterase
MKVSHWPLEPWEELIAVIKRCRQLATREEKIETKNRLRELLDHWKGEAWFGLTWIDLNVYERFIAFDCDLFFQYLEKGPFAAGDLYHYRRELTDFAKIECPVLAIWGEKDRFIPSYRSSALFRNCMSEAGNPDVTCKILPGASHLISIPGERFRLAEGYPQVMVNWVVSKFPVIR